MSEALSKQAEEAQRRIDDATKVARQTQYDVRDLSSLARQADVTAKKTAMELEIQVQQMAQRLEEQRLQAERQTQSARLERENLAQQLADAQRGTQSSVTTSQHYMVQLQELNQKMQGLETLLIEQRQKGGRLESALSAAQDRIGGAERRAAWLEEENSKIRNELQSWNDWYDTDPTQGKQASEELTSPVSQPAVSTSIPLNVAQPEPSFGDAVNARLSTPLSSPILSAPLAGMGNVGHFDSTGSFIWHRPGHPSDNMGQPRIPPFPSQPSARRDSFGSVFPGSSGTGGNGNGTGTGSGIAGPTPRMGLPTSATFNIGIKPKEPPVFHGKANEDVDTWLAKVGDFMYLTEANDRQQVAYMATLLQDAAADWWTSLLKERHGVRPLDFFEMTNLLQRRFGSTTRVDRARAELRNIKQGQSEGVRSYSTRFEGLLAKLPSFDQEWAKSQFVWGLHQRVAELVVISNPRNLREAINQAENIEMARNQVATGHSTQGQKVGSWSRGRGSFSRGRGRFNAVQQSPGQGTTEVQQIAAQQVQGQQGQVGYNQCRRCKGYGHWADDCPSYRQGSGRSRGGRYMRGRAGRGRRGGRGVQRGRGRNTAVNASLTASGSGAPAQPPPVQDATPVPSPSRQGN